MTDPGSRSSAGNVAALLLVDPYNDFISQGGKLWLFVEEVALAVGLLENLRRIVAKARDSGMPVFIVPHHRAEPDEFAGWKHPTPYQLAGSKMQVFAKGSWGAEWHPDFIPQPGDTIVKEHWGGNGFQNTDLDFLLKQRAISQVTVVGMIANTCIETTSRHAAELGYHVTLVKDATAAFSQEAMHCAHDINGPNFAHQILTTDQWLASVG